MLPHLLQGSKLVQYGGVSELSHHIDFFSLNGFGFIGPWVGQLFERGTQKLNFDFACPFYEVTSLFNPSHFFTNPCFLAKLEDKDNFYQRLIRGGREGPGSPMAAWCLW